MRSPVAAESVREGSKIELITKAGIVVGTVDGRTWVMTTLKLDNEDQTGN